MPLKQDLSLRNRQIPRIRHGAVSSGLLMDISNSEIKALRSTPLFTPIPVMLFGYMWVSPRPMASVWPSSISRSSFHRP